jgi:hypothetical protein
VVEIPVMAVASIAMGGVVKVAVKGTGWTQPLNVYATAVGLPGTGKAEGLDHIDRPLRREQERRRADYEQQVEDYEKHLRIWKIVESVWNSKYRAWLGDQKYPAKSHTHSSDCPQDPGASPEKPEEPSQSHVFAAQGTIEGIAKSMARSPKFGLLTDELSALILGLNQ